LQSKIYNYQLRLLRRLFPVQVPKQAQIDLPYQKIGSDYGFVAVPDGVLGKGSIVYSVGAGLDVRADVDLVSHYGCDVYIMDPTPRAVQHFKALKAAVAKGETFYNEGGERYEATTDTFEHLHYEAVALWDRDEMVRFFEPENPDNISHSITDIQSSGRAIEVSAQTLPTLMQRLGHKQVDYLKLDIEGAEFRVVDHLLAAKALPRVLYLEYHYDRNITPLRNIRMIQKSLSDLYAAGYKVFYQSNRRYFGLILNAM
jgi:FkbM family methyltransferase